LLQILAAQASIVRDTREHFRTDLFSVVKLDSLHAEREVSARVYLQQFGKNITYQANGSSR
jgi:hypothetical protein